MPEPTAEEIIAAAKAEAKRIVDAAKADAEAAVALAVKSAAPVLGSRKLTAEEAQRNFEGEPEERCWSLPAGFPEFDPGAVLYRTEDGLAVFDPHAPAPAGGAKPPKKPLLAAGVAVEILVDEDTRCRAAKVAVSALLTVRGVEFLKPAIDAKILLLRKEAAGEVRFVANVAKQV